MPRPAKKILPIPESFSTFNFLDGNSIEYIKILDNPIDKALVYFRLQMWQTAFEWVIRWEWQADFPFSCKRKIAACYESKGRILQQIFFLCERCHSFQDQLPGLDVPYKHSNIWFAAILNELKIESSQVVPVCIERKKEKLREYLAELKKGEDLETVGDSENIEKYSEADFSMSAFGLLVKVATKLSEVGGLETNNFYKNYWKPYIKALRDDAKQMEGPEYVRVFPDEDGLYARMGAGKHDYTITSSNLGTKSGSLQRLRGKGFKT